MPLSPWKKIRQVFELGNPWWEYRKDEVLLPSGKTGEYHFVHTPGSSMIIPVLDDGNLLLVNQYRYLANRESLEFPCGSVKDGSSYEDTARQELAEETGFQAKDLPCVTEFNPYNGITDEICKVFIARGLTRFSVKHDETEEFELLQLAPAKLQDYIRSGKIWDGMTLAAWALVKHRLMK